MKESAQIALSYLRSHGAELELPVGDLAERGIHVHVPAGAVPKDGPSAGITMTTALASLLSGRPVRADVAMTGEVSLTGRVLPIGGVKQKLLAAHRAGITTVLLPRRNEPDLDDVPEAAFSGDPVLTSRFSSDWPGQMRTALEQAYPGSVGIEMAGLVGSVETPTVWEPESTVVSNVPGEKHSQPDSYNPDGCSTVYPDPIGATPVGNPVDFLAAYGGSVANTAEAALAAQEPAFVAKYAFQLAQAFNNFYHHHRILSEPDAARQRFLLYLVYTVNETLRLALDLLGIEVPERM